jgi:HEAT repeat protein
MKRVPLAALAALAFGAAAHGDTPVLTVQIQNTLTALDAVPTTAEIDSDFTDPGTALTSLSDIAVDPSATTGLPDGTGIRIRTLHALSSYCTSPCGSGDPAHVALTEFIKTNEDDQTGTTIVMLRGAIEALGPQRYANDLSLLEPLLSHPSRDIRAATAHALRDLCNTDAITPLRVQQAQESSDQVRLAISEALRVLSQPSPCQ